MLCSIFNLYVLPLLEVSKFPSPSINPITTSLCVEFNRKPVLYSSITFDLINTSDLGGQTPLIGFRSPGSSDYITILRLQDIRRIVVEVSFKTSLLMNRTREFSQYGAG